MNESSISLDTVDHRWSKPLPKDLMCSPETITLQPGTDSVGMDRVVRAAKIPLTDGYPHLEQSWNVPGLNDDQADMIPVVEDTHK